MDLFDSARSRVIVFSRRPLTMPSIPGFAALRAPHPSSPARRGGAKQIEAQRPAAFRAFFPCKALQERGSRRPCTKKAQRKALSFNLFAEREGFEPPDPLRSTVFKTAAFDHSAISPKSNVISLHVTFSVKWTAKISTFFEIASGWEEKA